MLRKCRGTSLALFAAISLPSYVHGEDLTALGGELTSSLKGKNAIQLPAPNIVSDERRLRQISGFDTFHGLFKKQSGLGPKFNNRSCGGCHVNNGRGPVGFSPDAPFGNAMVVRVSLAGNDLDGSPKNIPGVGEELLEQNLDGKLNFAISLSWKSITGKYPDGEKYSLRSSVLNFELPAKFEIIHTLLMTPTVIGVGLLEVVSDEKILELSDPEDLNHDGISGKINLVPNIRKRTKSIGRFGYKATEPTLEQQSAAALARDIGISNSLFKTKETEISDDELERLVVYQAIAGVQKARDQSEPGVKRGRKLFSAVGCEGCHISSLTTGESGDERANQMIHPFTDLLLHDMGGGLASLRGEFDATGAEWRTTPLWGVGYGKQLSRVKQRFLHDGRARSLEEAILWHDGEARTSRRKFMQLNKRDRLKLIEFLNSL